MYFAKLAEYLEKLEKTSSRNEMTLVLAEVLKKSGKDEIDKICYLLLGELVPPYTGVEFNLAEKMMVQALAFAYLDKVSEMTDNLLSAEVAKILADGRVWMLVGGLFVILGLSLFVTGLRSKVTPSREK